MNIKPLSFNYPMVQALKENALEIKNKPIKILKYVYQTNQSTN